MNKNKSKYFYTASLMNQALLALLERKDIEFISITELTKKAGVNRTTFYLHYENMYDLLEETIENLNKEFLTSFALSSTPAINSPRSAFLLTEEYLVPYLSFCKKHKRLFRLVHQKPLVFQNEKMYKKMYETIFYPAISQFLKSDVQKTYLLEFYTRGVVGIINKWIELDCNIEMSELIEIIKNCVGYQ